MSGNSANICSLFGMVARCFRFRSPSCGSIDASSCGQNKQSRSFLDKVLAQGVEFDILGQSYYPKWHGTLGDLKSNLTDLVGRYKQDVMLVEYSVPNIRQINDTVHGLPSGKGLGTFIWEPTRWEGPALFDGKGNTKPEIDVYAEMANEYGLLKLKGEEP